MELDGKVAFTKVMQVEFDGIGDRFKKLHKERGQIVSLWKATMASLAERDAEMNDIAEV